MSGRDERVIHERPQCQECKLDADIVLIYSNGNMAGWILRESEEKALGATILVSTHFPSDLDIVQALCGGCGHLDNDIADKAIAFFKKEQQVMRYINWSGWQELIKREW